MKNMFLVEFIEWKMLSMLRHHRLYNTALTWTTVCWFAPTAKVLESSCKGDIDVVQALTTLCHWMIYQKENTNIDVISTVAFYIRECVFFLFGFYMHFNESNLRTLLAPFLWSSNYTHPHLSFRILLDLTHLRNGATKAAHRNKNNTAFSNTVLKNK